MRPEICPFCVGTAHGQQRHQGKGAPHYRGIAGESRIRPLPCQRLSTMPPAGDRRWPCVRGADKDSPPQIFMPSALGPSPSTDRACSPRPRERQEADRGRRMSSLRPAWGACRGLGACHRGQQHAASAPQSAWRKRDPARWRCWTRSRACSSRRRVPNSSSWPQGAPGSTHPVCRVCRRSIGGFWLRREQGATTCTTQIAFSRRAPDWTNSLLAALGNGSGSSESAWTTPQIW